MISSINPATQSLLQELSHVEEIAERLSWNIQSFKSRITDALKTTFDISCITRTEFPPNVLGAQQIVREFGQEVLHQIQSNLATLQEIRENPVAENVPAHLMAVRDVKDKMEGYVQTVLLKQQEVFSLVALELGKLTATPLSVGPALSSEKGEIQAPLTLEVPHEGSALQPITLSSHPLAVPFTRGVQTEFEIRVSMNEPAELGMFLTYSYVPSQSSTETLTPSPTDQTLDNTPHEYVYVYAVVKAVVEGSIAAMLGVCEKDIITCVNGCSAIGTDYSALKRIMQSSGQQNSGSNPNSTDTGHGRGVKVIRFARLVDDAVLAAPPSRWAVGPGVGVGIYEHTRVPLGHIVEVSQPSPGLSDRGRTPFNTPPAKQDGEFPAALPSDMLGLGEVTHNHTHIRNVSSGSFSSVSAEDLQNFHALFPHESSARQTQGNTPAQQTPHHSPSFSQSSESSLPSPLSNVRMQLLKHSLTTNTPDLIQQYPSAMFSIPSRASTSSAGSSVDWTMTSAEGEQEPPAPTPFSTPLRTTFVKSHAKAPKGTVSVIIPEPIPHPHRAHPSPSTTVNPRAHDLIGDL